MQENKEELSRCQVPMVAKVTLINTKTGKTMVMFRHAGGDLGFLSRLITNLVSFSYPTSFRLIYTLEIPEMRHQPTLPPQ